MVKNPKTAETVDSGDTAVLTEAPAPTTAPAVKTAKTERKAVAKRLWIDAEGNEVDENLATGARYINLESGEAVDYQTGGTPGHPSVMFAIFGALTLFGNIANTRVNGLDGSGSEAVADIKERLALIVGGAWKDKSEGARGPKYDLTKLATAFVDAKKASNPEWAGTYDAVLQKLTEDKSFFAKVRSVPEIQTRYAELVGKTAKTVDDLDL